MGLPPLYQVTGTGSLPVAELAIPLAVGRNAELVVSLHGDLQPGDLRRASEMLCNVADTWLEMLAREEKP
jgi:hypothetical protein